MHRVPVAPAAIAEPGDVERPHGTVDPGEQRFAFAVGQRGDALPAQARSSGPKIGWSHSRNPHGLIPAETPRGFAVARGREIEEREALELLEIAHRRVERGDELLGGIEFGECLTLGNPRAAGRTRPPPADGLRRAARGAEFREVSAESRSRAADR